MNKTFKLPEVYQHPSGVKFRVRLRKYPPKSKSPKYFTIFLCPMTEEGKLVRCSELYGSLEDKKIAERSISGTDVDELFRSKAIKIADDMVEQMRKVGLLASAEQEELSLAYLYMENANMFWKSVSWRWNEKTLQSHRSQFEQYVLPHLSHITDGLSLDDYDELMEILRGEALKTSRPTTQQILSANDTPLSPSGKLRQKLLNLFLRFVKDALDCPINIVLRDNQEPKSNIEKLAARVCDLRLYSAGMRTAMGRWLDKADEDEECLFLALAADSMLRINELFGLTFDSIFEIDGSQGTQYYVQVSGQWSLEQRKRINQAKSDAGNRNVPLSQVVGKRLRARRNRLEKKYGDLGTRMLLGIDTGEKYDDTGETINMREARLEEKLKLFLRDNNAARDVKDRIFTSCVPEFALDKIEDSLVFHSLRRNGASCAFFLGAVPIRELEQQIGHKSSDASPAKRGDFSVKNDTELYAACLDKQTRYSLFQPRMPLRYSTTHKGHPETIATEYDLAIAPGDTVLLTISEPAPGTNISFSGDLEIEKVYSDEIDNTANERLLLSEEYLNIVQIRKPFTLETEE